MDYWNEIRTAAVVARFGKVTPAAEFLGIHRATVIRHVDVLEQQFGEKLFIRSNKGYTRTDFGSKLLAAANAASGYFEELKDLAASKPNELDFELVISAPAIITQTIAPIVAEFLVANNKMSVKLVRPSEDLKLERGEIDIAFVIGDKPDHQDYVVEHFIDFKFGFYATSEYLNNYGVLDPNNSASNHKFIFDRDAQTKELLPHWIQDRLSNGVSRISASGFEETEQLVASGLGIGFLPVARAQLRSEFFELCPPRPEWKHTFWRVTHVDAHRSKKISSFLKVVRKSKPISIRQFESQAIEVQAIPSNS